MPRTQLAWGIDVGTTALKAVQLRRDGDKVFLEAIEIIEHSRFLTEPDVDQKETVRDTLSKFLEKHVLRGQEVFVGSSGAASFSRFVKLPPVEPRKIPDIVRFEAIQQIPFPLDQVNWGYHSFRNTDSPEVEIGIFAIKTDLVTKLLADFRALGITVHGVQILPLAVCNALMYEGRGTDKSVIVLDVGADHTDLIILDQGRLWLRNINIGGNTFTEALTKNFQLPFAKAENLKKNAATSKYAREIYQSMRPTFSDVVLEIQRSIGYYNSSHRESRLEQVVGLGGGFKLSNMQKYLTQNLSMDVQRLDNFAKVDADSRIAAGLSDKVQLLAGAYGLALQAVGLGTINTNLLPQEIARQMLWKKKTPWFVATAAAFVVGTGLMGTKYYLDASSFAASMRPSRQTLNDARLEKANAWQQAYNSISNTYLQNRAKISSVLSLTSYRNLWPEILNCLYDALPQAGNTVATTQPLTSAPTTLPTSTRIMIQSIDSQYESMLSVHHHHHHGHAMAPSPQPFMPGQMPAAGAESSLGAPGFAVTITGYTTVSHSELYAVLQNYRDRLRSIAPEGGKKLPFYIVIPRNDLSYGEIGRMGAGESAGFVPWGSHVGPFASVFMSKFMPPVTKTKHHRNRSGGNFQNNFGPPGNFVPPGMQNFNGLPGFGGSNGEGFGRVFNGGQSGFGKLGMINPDTRKPLNGAWAFRLKILIFLRR
ncbi:MAG: type IV pilus assembly protein PilM [Phycisphaerae bacterium]